MIIFCCRSIPIGVLMLLVGLSAPAAWAQNALLRDFQCQDAGVSDAYACNLPVTPGSYVTGQRYLFKANTVNTGAATVNFNSLGAVTIKKAVGGVTTDLADNDLRAGQWVYLVYDGTNMQMLSHLGNDASGGGGSPIILDLGDAGTNQSLAIGEIATSGDTNSIFTESAADKLLITLSNDWPKADTADDLTCTDCIGPTEITDLTLGTDTAGNYAGSASEGGAATTATALAANGANCTPGEAAGGVDASGAAEDCFAPAGTGDITRVAACQDGNCGIEGGNDIFPVLYEGTANTEETTISVTEPTADHTIAFPANSGTVAVAVTAPITLSATGVVAVTQDAGTDITANLEEETHATEHQDGGADEVALDGSQITTGTVVNARTTAVSANTASAIVARDANGDFAARDIDLRKILPTVGTTQFLQAGTSIDCSTGFWVQICGSTDGVACSAAVDLTVDPQITAGTKGGQICILLGADTTNTVTLDTGTGLRLREQRVLGADGDGFLEAIWLRWTGSLWEEVIPKGVQLGSTESLQTTHDVSGANPEIDVGANGIVISDLTSVTKSWRECNTDETQCWIRYIDATLGPVETTLVPVNTVVTIPDTLDYFLKDSAGANIIAVDEATRVVSLPDTTLLDLSAINASSQTEGLKLPQTTTPAPTAEGLCAWDTDDDQLKCGDGATTTTIGSGGAVATLHSFRPQQNEPPAATFATLDTRNSHPVLVFVDASDTSAVFSDVVHRGYAGGDIIVDIHSASTSVTTNAYGWCAAFERIGTALDIDADSFATAKCISTTVSGTTGILVKSTITFSNAEADAIAVGEGFRLKITRDGDGSTVTDSATDSANFRFAEVRQ